MVEPEKATIEIACPCAPGGGGEGLRIIVEILESGLYNPDLIKIYQILITKIDLITKFSTICTQSNEETAIIK